MPEIGWAGNPVKLVAFHFIVGNLSQMQKELLIKPSRNVSEMGMFGFQHLHSTYYRILSNIP